MYVFRAPYRQCIVCKQPVAGFSALCAAHAKAWCDSEARNAFYGADSTPAADAVLADWVHKARAA